MDLSKYVCLLSSTILFSFSICISSAKADSPLTSTDLTPGYENLAIVRQLQVNKTMNQDVVDFLLSGASLDQKAAVINALGWNIEGQNNGELFLQGLLRKKRMKSIQQLQLKDLTAEDKFVLGYLLAMDDYFNLSPLDVKSRQGVLTATPLELLSQSAFALPDDFTVHFVKSLVEAQLNLSNSWCSIYLAPTEVLRLFPENRRNLNPQAVSKAMEYMNLYRDNCFGFD